MEETDDGSCPLMAKPYFLQEEESDDTTTEQEDDAMGDAMGDAMDDDMGDSSMTFEELCAMSETIKEDRAQIAKEKVNPAFVSYDIA